MRIGFDGMGRVIRFEMIPARGPDTSLKLGQSRGAAIDPPCPEGCKWQPESRFPDGLEAWFLVGVVKQRVAAEHVRLPNRGRRPEVVGAKLRHTLRCQQAHGEPHFLLK